MYKSVDIYIIFISGFVVFFSCIKYERIFYDERGALFSCFVGLRWILWLAFARIGSLRRVGGN